MISIINVLTGQTIKEISYCENNPFYPNSIKEGTTENTLLWNGNKLMQFGDSTYKYNSNGIRIEANVGDKTIKYILEGNDIIRMNIKKGELDESIDFIYDSNSKLVGLTTAEGDYFYVRDITGNIIGLVDSYGEYVIKYKYNSWGKLLSELPDEDDENFCLAARFNPFMYKGYYYDKSTKLYYCNSRYYSSDFCRWISPDSIEYLCLNSVNGLNLYCYCFNNPIMYKDKSGNYPEWISVFGSTAENILNFTETLLNTVLKPTSLSMHQARALARKSGHLYSARHFIRDRNDDIARTLKLSKNISRAANVIGSALFVMDVTAIWYTNYNSGNDTWITDSLTDTLIEGGIFAIGYIPGWGWIASLGLTLIKYIIEECTTWIEDLKKLVAEEPIVRGLLFGIPFMFIGEN